MIKRQRDERIYANSATADAARALDGAIENKQGRPVLEKLKNQYLTALKYSDTTLPIQQAQELAAAKAAQGQ